MQRIFFVLLALFIILQIGAITGCQNVDRLGSEGRPNQIIPSPDYKPSPPSTTQAPHIVTSLYTRVLCLSNEASKSTLDSFLSSASERTRFDSWQILLDANKPATNNWFSTVTGTLKLSRLKDIVAENGLLGKLQIISAQSLGLSEINQLTLVKSEVDVLTGQVTGTQLDVIPEPQVTQGSFSYFQQQALRYFSHPANSAVVMYGDLGTNGFKIRNLKDGSIKVLPFSTKEYFQPLLSQDGVWVSFMHQHSGVRLDLVACRTDDLKCHVLAEGSNQSFPAQAVMAVNDGIFWMVQSGKSIRIHSARWDQVPNENYAPIHVFTSDAPALMALYESGSNLSLVFTQEEWRTAKLFRGTINLLKINSSSLTGENITQASYPESLANSQVFSNRGALMSLQAAPWSGKVFATAGASTGVFALDFFGKDWNSYRPESATPCRTISVAPEVVQETKP